MKLFSKKKWLFTVLAIIVILMICGVFAVLNIHPVSYNTDETISDVYRDFEVWNDEQLNNRQLNICIITKSYGSAYWDTLIQGAIDSAKERDVNLNIAGVAVESNTDRLAYLMEEALSMNPDAIIVSPADTARINEIVDSINEKNIPLIFVDTILNGQKFDACYMTDNIQAGRMVAGDMITKLKSAGYTEKDELTVGIDIGFRGSQTIIERLAGVNEYWANNAPDNWKIIDDIKVNEGSSEVAYKQCLEFMDENDNLAGLIGLNNGSTVGLCRGISERQRKDIALVGFDYSEEMASLIEEGEYNVSTMVQLQYNMGYGSVETAVNICNGEDNAFKYYNTGIAKVNHKNYDNSYIKKDVLRQ